MGWGNGEQGKGGKGGKETQGKKVQEKGETRNGELTKTKEEKD